VFAVLVKVVHLFFDRLERRYKRCHIVELKTAIAIFQKRRRKVEWKKVERLFDLKNGVGFLSKAICIDACQEHDEDQRAIKRSDVASLNSPATMTCRFSARYQV